MSIKNYQKSYNLSINIVIFIDFLIPSPAGPIYALPLWALIFQKIPVGAAAYIADWEMPVIH